MIKTIIFDLGGVILLQNKMNMGQFLSQIFNVSLQKASYFYQKHKKNLQTGKITSNELLAKGKVIFRSTKSINNLPQYQKAPDHSQEMNGFGKRESPSVRGFSSAIYNHGSKKPPTIVGGASLSEWKQLYKNEVIGLNLELLQYINKLKQNLNIYLFSNTIDTHAEYFKSFQIEQIFKKFYKSYEIGMRKPDKKVYLFLINEAKSKPGETIIIDDSEENVIAAEKLGIKGIIYKKFTQLKEDLDKFKVKI